MKIKSLWIYGEIRKIYKKIKKKYYQTQDKVFISSKNTNCVRLPYLLKKYKGGGTLLVVFSGCYEGGATYNYVGTCNKLKVNRLYIKDDFAPNHRGCYYIGSDGMYNVEMAVCELIDSVVQKLNIDKLIFAGSSKGGYAALNFSLMYKGSYAICGAPQYYLANYLNNSTFYVNLKEIVGKITDESIETLNNRLKLKIYETTPTQTIYMIYSSVEHTYKEHIEDMIHDLKSAGFQLNECQMDFEEHGDIGKYFPSYLIDSIVNILKEK